jgi:CO dehydrogenase maturation factor
MFRLNPFVADIPEVYAQSIAGVRVLVAGGVKKGGAGCYCPENSLVRALVSHLLLDEKVALVVDMEAGLEHLSRGTVDSVDRLLVVVEPSRSSVETTRRIQRMAGDIGLRRVLAVGSKVRGPEDEVFLREALGGLSFAGCVPYDARIGDAERAGRGPYGISSEVDAAVDGIVQQLQR